MTRKIALAFAAILATSSVSLAYDWTAPDADQPNVPTVGEQASMTAPAKIFNLGGAPVATTSIYDMSDQNGTIDGKPDFESD